MFFRIDVRKTFANLTFLLWLLLKSARRLISFITCKMFVWYIGLVFQCWIGWFGSINRLILFQELIWLPKHFLKFSEAVLSVAPHPRVMVSYILRLCLILWISGSLEIFQKFCFQLFFAVIFLFFSNLSFFFFLDILV